jgi:hypothetical protein
VHSACLPQARVENIIKINNLESTKNNIRNYSPAKTGGAKVDIYRVAPEMVKIS